VSTRRKKLEKVFDMAMKDYENDRQVVGGHLHEDQLAECFAVQKGFMGMLKEDGRFPEWPLDLSSKENQRKLQGFLWDTVREISEASATLKNRPHRVQEEQFDKANFLEEMSDAFAFFMESLLLAGFDANDLYEAYTKKMAVVREGLITGER